ncbi:MAG TPA: diguanylate cyclase [Caldimonas sp.]
MKPAPPTTSKRYAAEWLALLLALAIAAALIGYELQQDYTRIGAIERDRLAGQARVVDENLGHQLDGINKALASIRADYARPSTERSGSTSERLTILSDAIPGVANMFLLDPRGTVVASRESVLIGRNFREREYFSVPNRARDGDTLYVSPPFKTIRGTFVIVVGRVLTGPKGEFEGVVVAALDAGYFDVVMRSVLYASDMSVVLAHADGKVFVGMPREAEAWEAGSFDAALRPAGAHQGADSVRLVTASVGATTPNRILALRAVAPPELHMDKPLVIAVSRRESAVYESWRRHAIELGGFFAALLLTSTLGLYRSQWRRCQFDRLAASAEEERRRGAERLELALRGAELGLWDWDVVRDRSIQNELTQLQLGYEGGEIGSDGAAWRALIHPDDAERITLALQAHFRQESESYESEFRIRQKSGQWAWLLSRGKVVERAADGRPLRMVGTHMDITERKRIELELQRLNERLTQLSTIDGLTEVGNRRLFDQTLNAEWSRAARKRETVTLLMIDIDHFKDYNDCYGHPTGDECLRTVARLVSETVKREGELVARYGGEEFALLLPGADLEVGRAVAQRCLSAVADAKIEHRASSTSAWVTMSIGVASATAGAGIKPSVLVDTADAALYRAKRAGRGRYES